MLLLSPTPQLVPQVFSTSREQPSPRAGWGEDPPSLQWLDSQAFGLPPGRVPSLPFQDAQSHTETRFLLNMFLISEERQGRRASISCIHGGYYSRSQGHRAWQRGTSSHRHWPQLP